MIPAENNFFYRSDLTFSIYYRKKHHYSYPSSSSRKKCRCSFYLFFFFVTKITFIIPGIFPKKIKNSSGITFYLFFSRNIFYSLESVIISKIFKKKLKKVYCSLMLGNILLVKKHNYSHTYTGIHGAGQDPIDVSFSRLSIS